MAIRLVPSSCLINNHKKLVCMLKKALLSLRMSLFIQTQKTPNPDFLKFLPSGKVVMGDKGTVDIPNEDIAISVSELGRKLFKVEGVNRVFYGPNYISISKTEKVDWNFIKPMIFDLIQEHFQSGKPLLRDPKSNEEGILETDSETVQMIKQILWSRVKPTVQDDGGDVKYIQFDQKTGVLTLEMLGSCAGCPSSSATLKNGILKMMKHYVGEVNDVVAVEYNRDLKKEK